VRNFLESRQRQGMKTVLIITGRGLRSKNGESVIRSDIEAYLRTRAKAWVVEWGRAPKQYGGDGALVVFLR
jgi:DNA-nicking Smr family endonuclease